MHDFSWQSVNRCLFTPDRELVANLKNDFTQVQINKFTRLTGAWEGVIHGNMGRNYPQEHGED